MLVTLSGVAIIERIIRNRLCSIPDCICTRKCILRFDQMVAYIEDVIFPITFVVIICSTIERRTPNACDAVGNRDACKAAAMLERIIPNTCDAVWDSDAC